MDAKVYSGRTATVHIIWKKHQKDQEQLQYKLEIKGKIVKHSAGKF